MVMEFQMGSQTHRAETRDGGKGLLGFNAFIQDAMNDASLRAESDELITKLLESDRNKNEFLASLAHELRNPLAPIKCALDSMGLMELNSEVEALREMMNRQVGQLVHLIDGLLDVSRISCGKLVLEKEVVPLRAIIKSAIEASSTFIAESGQMFTVSDLSDNAFVLADSTRLTQVVTNLLNNSAKYSGPGCHIDLTISQDDEFVVIRVHDNGIGIAVAKLSNIFELYAQVGDSGERGSPGLGIGLSLVKTLVELHSGSVIAESEGIGHGSVFTVRLPTVEPPPDVKAGTGDTDAMITKSMRSFRILVVEDQRALRLVMARLLEKLGHVVQVAEAGAQAIETLDRFKPEIIFSDISMPGMNGYELVRKLRRRPDTQSAFIVALTGSGTAIDRKSALESGFDEHLSKPVDIQSLRNLFERVSVSIPS